MVIHVLFPTCLSSMAGKEERPIKSSDMQEKYQYYNEIIHQTDNT